MEATTAPSIFIYVWSLWTMTQDTSGSEPAEDMPLWQKLALFPCFHCKGIWESNLLAQSASINISMLSIEFNIFQKNIEASDCGWSKTMRNSHLHISRHYYSYTYLIQFSCTSRTVMIQFPNGILQKRSHLLLHSDSSAWLFSKSLLPGVLGYLISNDECMQVYFCNSLYVIHICSHNFPSTLYIVFHFSYLVIWAGQSSSNDRIIWKFITNGCRPLVF